MRIIYRFFGDVTSTVNHAHSLHTTTYDHEEEAGEVRENSIEIIFDKNASNNNSGNKAASEGGKTGKNCVF